MSAEHGEPTLRRLLQGAVSAEDVKALFEWVQV
jgi:hypothetical protein